MTAPKPKSQRRGRNITPGFIQLDPAGRKGDPPPWPIMENALPPWREAEERKWAELWTLPQAIEWERMKCFGDVALYVRIWVQVVSGTADPRLISEMRQIDATIGVTPKAMQGLRWEIPQQHEEPEQGTARPALHSIDKRAYVPTAAAQ